MAVAVLSLNSACGHKKIKYSGDEAQVFSTEAEGKGLRAKVDWVKPKAKEIDIQLVATNSYSHAISFKYSAIKLMVGDLENSRKRTPLTGEMAAGESQTGLCVFHFENKLPKSGKLLLTIDPIYKGESSSEKAEAAQKLPPLKIELAF